MRPDFSRLYSQLNLRPDCTLEELKQAYRRRIAGLHPDRPVARKRHPDADAVLADLISLYSVATRFHRRHGRLPGGNRVRSGSAPATPTRTGVFPAPVSPPGTTEPNRAPGKTFGVSFLLVVLALVLLATWDQPTPGASAEISGTRMDPSAAAVAAVTHQLERGMDASTVLAIQGEPDGVRDGMWMYGPSWVAFEEGRLVDWHSSSLRPLKTETRAPRPVGAAR